MTYKMDADQSMNRLRRDLWHNQMKDVKYNKNIASYEFDYDSTAHFLADASYFKSQTKTGTVEIAEARLKEHSPWLVATIDYAEKAGCTLKKKLELLNLNCWIRNSALSEPFFNEAKKMWEVWYQLDLTEGKHIDMGRHFLRAIETEAGELILTEQVSSDSLVGPIDHIEKHFPGFTERFNTSLALGLPESERVRYCAPKRNKPTPLQSLAPPDDWAA